MENSDSRIQQKRRKSSESPCVPYPGDGEIDAHTDTKGCEDHRRPHMSENGPKEANTETEDAQYSRCNLTPARSNANLPFLGTGDLEDTDAYSNDIETEQFSEATARGSPLLYTEPRARRRRRLSSFKIKSIPHPSRSIRNHPQQCKRQAHCAEERPSSSKNHSSSPVSTRLYLHGQLGSDEQDLPSSRQSVPKVTNLQIRVVNTEVSFFAATLQTKDDTIASDRALESLKDILGAATKIDDISLKRLAAARGSTWLLTGFSSSQRNANGSTDQSSSQLICPYHTSDLQQRARALLWKDSEGSKFANTADSEISESLETDSGSDVGTIRNLSTRRVNRAWSTLEEQRVLAWRKEGLDWNQIAAKLSGRSRGAIYLRWHTKLRHDGGEEI